MGNTVVPLFKGHSCIQASVPTLRVSPHQGDRHSGMGVGGVVERFGYGYEKCSVHVQCICKKEDMVMDQ